MDFVLILIAVTKISNGVLEESTNSLSSLKVFQTEVSLWRVGTGIIFVIPSFEIETSKFVSIMTNPQKSHHNFNFHGATANLFSLYSHRTNSDKEFFLVPSFQTNKCKKKGL